MRVVVLIVIFSYCREEALSFEKTRSRFGIELNLSRYIHYYDWRDCLSIDR
jgi:hypothetical protein